MSLPDLFLSPDGRLRAGWRAVLFVVIFIVSLLVVSLLVSFTGQVPSVALQVMITAGATGLATWVMLRWMEGAPFVSIGLDWGRRAGTGLVHGLGVGVGAVWAVTAIELAMGAIRFESRSAGGGSPELSSAVMTVLMLTGLLTVGATAEEILFRGYPFQRILEGTNGTVAVLITSAAFGWVHGSNPYATNLAVLNTILAGVLLGIGYLKTGALWWPIGFHFGWNWMLAVIGHPVSGLDVAQLPWEIVTVSEPEWVHGGSYGPEGGVVASAVLAASIVGILFFLPHRGSPPAAASADLPD